jgi:hypothetical protein
MESDLVTRTFRIPRTIYEMLVEVCDGIKVSSVNHAVVLAIYRLLIDEPWHKPCNSSYEELVSILKRLTSVGGVQRGERKVEMRKIRALLMTKADEPVLGETPWREDPVFLQAWKSFPSQGRRRSSSRQAWRVWRLMSVPERMLIDRAIQIEQLENSDWAAGYCPGFHRWLQAERWRDLSSEFPEGTHTRPTKATEGTHDVF